jgi:RNA polymerase sigma factor (sigma-70 family)
MTTQAKLIQNPALTLAQVEDRAQGITAEEFIALYDEFFPRVYNYVRYRCNDAALADDLTALAFERALKYLSDYQPQRAPFGAWMFAIVRNVVNNHLRSARQQAWTPLDELPEHPAAGPLPEEIIIQAETQRALLDAMEYLNHRERDVLGLKFGGHLTNRRIAQVTGLTEANVGVILYRALHKLRRIMDEPNLPST